MCPLDQCCRVASSSLTIGIVEQCVELDFVFLCNLWLCQITDTSHDKLGVGIFCYQSTEPLWKGSHIPAFGVATNSDIMPATRTLAPELA